MRDLVRGYAAATLEPLDADSSRALGAELGALGAEILRHGELRLALTDGTVPPAERQALLTELLAPRASAACTALAGFAAHYELPSEFGPTIGALALLAERAEVFAPERAAGRTAARERLRGYAERVFEQLDERAEVDRVEDELFAIARLLDTHGDLRRALADVNVPLGERSAILDDVLGAKVATATARLARYVLRAGRTRDLVGTFEWLVGVAARERGRRVAEVRSAVALDEGETGRLAAALGRLVGRTVEVRVIIDPSIVGGILVEVGDLVIDGTVRLRFERLRDLLVQPS